MFMVVRERGLHHCSDATLRGATRRYTVLHGVSWWCGNEGYITAVTRRSAVLHGATRCYMVFHGAQLEVLQRHSPAYAAVAEDGTT